MVTLPELGVGVVYSPGLEPWLEAGEHLMDLIEIEPQAFWFRSPTAGGGDGSPRARMDRDAWSRFESYLMPKTVHGVGFPIGGTVGPDDQSLELLKETVELLRAPWISEHLSFNRVDRDGEVFNAGFLLPPIQSEQTVRLAARRIRELQSKIPVPFAFETGVSYLKPQPGELADGEFYGRIAEEADCGILLDLHNLWCNEWNGRSTVSDVLSQIPLDRVWEVHLAGGETYGDYWLDAHSDLVPDALLGVAAEVIPQLPNLKAIVFEILADYVEARGISTEAFVAQLQTMQSLWARRGSAPRRTIRRTRRRSVDAEPPETDVWERTLAGLVIGEPSQDALGERLEEDAGVEVYRTLVTTIRSGMVVDALRLTYRLLRLSLGTAAVDALMREFWSEVPPEPFVTLEAKNFANFLWRKELNVPQLREVLDFELASHRVLMDGRAESVPFSFEPMKLLEALGNGNLPDNVTQGSYDVTLTPEASLYR